MSSTRCCCRRAEYAANDARMNALHHERASSRITARGMLCENAGHAAPDQGHVAHVGGAHRAPPTHLVRGALSHRPIASAIVCVSIFSDAFDSRPPCFKISALRDQFRASTGDVIGDCVRYPMRHLIRHHVVSMPIRIQPDLSPHRWRQAIAGPPRPTPHDSTQTADEGRLSARRSTKKMFAFRKRRV